MGRVQGHFLLPHRPWVRIKGGTAEHPLACLSPGLLGLPHTRAFSQAVLTPWFPFLVSPFLSRPNFQVLPRVKNLPQLFQAEAAWNHPAKLTVTSSTKDGLIHLILPQRRRARRLRCSDQAGGTCGVLPSPPAGVAHAH